MNTLELIWTIMFFASFAVLVIGMLGLLVDLVRFLLSEDIPPFPRIRAVMFVLGFAGFLLFGTSGSVLNSIGAFS